jgi:CRP-like cAMP-binding protein
MFILKSGSVELLRKDPSTGLMRAIGYAKAGDPVGELTLFTGQRLAVTARVPEFAEAYVLTPSDFKRVFSSHPELCLRLCGVLATALGRARAALDEFSRAGSALGGSLGSFDLASVLNNIIETGESSGILTVADRRAQSLGEVAVRGHSISYARCAGYQGDDAVRSLLLGQWLGATFKFVPDHGVLRSYTEAEVVHSIPATLILDSLRMKDELARFENEMFGDKDAKVRSVAKYLSCPNPTVQSAYEYVFNWIQGGGSLATLREATPLRRLQAYEVLCMLLDAKQVEVVAR